MNSSAKKSSSKEDEKPQAPEKLSKILQDSAWYKRVVESMGDGIIATDLNRTIFFANTKMAKMLRYDMDELIGKTSLAIVIEEDRNKVIRQTEARYKEKKSSRYEINLKTKFGSALPVLVSATPILGDEGETVGTYALMTDISDRKIVEKELRKKNSELQSLYNNLLELYEQLGAIIAESTNIHSEIYLFTSKGCVYCAPAEEVLQEVLASYGGKITYRKVDIDEEPEFASQFDIMSLPTIIIGEEKLTSVPDIYKLHSALFSALVPEEKFRRTRQELDNIINYSPVAIFTINHDGILNGMNPLVEKMTGHKRSDIIGKNIIQPEKKELVIFPKKLIKLLKRALKGKTISENRIHLKKIKKKKPEPFSIISFKVVPMENKEGDITELLVLSEDVTTIAMQEEELAESYTKLEELNNKLLEMNKDRAVFVETTTTSLLEPLRSSKELIDKILSGQIGEINDETFGTIEYLRTNLTNVSKSLIDILDYNTLETQGYSLVLKKENVKALVSESMQTIGSVVIDKGFILMLDIPEDLEVWCDKEQVIQIMKNLILNAIKFTEKDCKIDISAKEVKNNFIEISVKDNGIGISKKDIERIFDQYVKVDPQTAGSGLGLAVVKNLVDAHCGTVKAKSEGVGKGSVFSFTLPKSKKIYEQKKSNKK